MNVVTWDTLFAVWLDQSSSFEEKEAPLNTTVFPKLKLFSFCFASCCLRAHCRITSAALPWLPRLRYMSVNACCSCRNMQYMGPVCMANLAGSVAAVTCPFIGTLKAVFSGFRGSTLSSWTIIKQKRKKERNLLVLLTLTLWQDRRCNILCIVRCRGCAGVQLQWARGVWADHLCWQLHYGAMVTAVIVCLPPFFPCYAEPIAPTCPDNGPILLIFCCCLPETIMKGKACAFGFLLERREGVPHCWWQS